MIGSVIVRDHASLPPGLGGVSQMLSMLQAKSAAMIACAGPARAVLVLLAVLWTAPPPCGRPGGPFFRDPAVRMRSTQF